MSMSSSSAAPTETEGLRLRLVRCPFCDIPVKKLRSGSPLNPGRIYYKCMNYNLVHSRLIYIYIYACLNSVSNEATFLFCFVKDPSVQILVVGGRLC